MDVFKGGGKGEIATADFIEDTFETIVDGIAVGIGDDLAGGQHRRMRLRPGNVLTVKPPVIIDRRIDILHQLRRPA